MKKAILLLTAIAGISLIISCGDDESSTPSNPSGPSIEVSAGVDITGSLAVDIPVVFQFTLNSDASVGIGNFTLTVNGNQVVNESSFGGNVVNSSFTYTTTFADAQNGGASLVFSMTDGNGTTATETVDLLVAAEYLYLNTNLTALPGFDLVANTTISDVTADSSVVDYNQETVFGGDQVIQSLNNTVLYEVPSAAIDILDPNLTRADLENVINSSNLVETVTIGPGQDISIVARLRDTDELVYISRIDTTFSPVRTGYRKTSANAGQ